MPILMVMFDEPGVTAVILRTLLAGTRFDRVNSLPATGSTNADVAALARAGGPEGFVLIADEQTSGRGRLDRTWASPPGASLAMSLLLRPPASSGGAWGWLSLIAGMAVTRGLRELSGAGERITLKWPNDVLVDGLKVCGILSERVETPDGPAAIVGIGINLRLEADELPVPHATSLALAGLPSERDAVTGAVLRAFDEVYTDLLSSGPPVRAYSDMCASIGAELTVIVRADEHVHGVGAGIDPDGRLVVDAGGILRAFAVGDVVHARLDEASRRDASLDTSI